LIDVFAPGFHEAGPQIGYAVGQEQTAVPPGAGVPTCFESFGFLGQQWLRAALSLLV
jgi:hypothetical protein